MSRALLVHGLPRAVEHKGSVAEKPASTVVDKGLTSVCTWRDGDLFGSTVAWVVLTTSAVKMVEGLHTGSVKWHAGSVKMVC